MHTRTQPFTRAAVLAAAVVLVAPLSACGQIPFAGPMTTQTRELDEVDAVDLRTSGDLTITQWAESHHSLSHYTINLTK